MDWLNLKLESMRMNYHSGMRFHMFRISETIWQLNQDNYVRTLALRVFTIWKIRNNCIILLTKTTIYTNRFTQYLQISEKKATMWMSNKKKLPKIKLRGQFCSNLHSHQSIVVYGKHEIVQYGETLLLLYAFGIVWIKLK
jgi:hypothetical protein